MYFFPKVVTGLIPVLADISQIVHDDWPEDGRDGARIPVEESIAQVHQSCRSQSRSISLRSAPISVESGLVDVEFGVSESETSWIQASRWVCDSLEASLSCGIIFDCCLQADIAHNQFVNDHGIGQCTVTCPGIVVIWIHR